MSSHFGLRNIRNAPMRMLSKPPFIVPFAKHPNSPNHSSPATPTPTPVPTPNPVPKLTSPSPNNTQPNHPCKQVINICEPIDSEDQMFECFEFFKAEQQKEEEQAQKKTVADISILGFHVKITKDK